MHVPLGSASIVLFPIPFPFSIYVVDEPMMLLARRDLSFLTTAVLGR